MALLLFAIFVVATIAYTILCFWQALLASRVIAAIEGTELAAYLKERTAPKIRWYGLKSPTGYDALNGALWREILRAPNPPANIAPTLVRMRLVSTLQAVAMAIAAVPFSIWVIAFLASLVRFS